MPDGYPGTATIRGSSLTALERPLCEEIVLEMLVEGGLRRFDDGLGSLGGCLDLDVARDGDVAHIAQVALPDAFYRLAAVTVELEAPRHQVVPGEAADALFVPHVPPPRGPLV